MDIRGLFSERALENKDFSRIIIEPTAREMESVKAFIDSFPDLISVDFVPPQFIALLGDFIGYDYLETEDTEVQREIMKRVINEYHKKGSLDQIYKACVRAHDENFFLGDLTYYRGKIDEGVASIEYPRDRMFRYDVSKWDMGHKWGDRKYVMHGVMEISISKMNDRTISYLDKIIPGGIKYYLNILRDISPTEGGYNKGSVYFPYDAHEHDMIVYHDLGQVKAGSRKVFVFDDTKWDEKRFEGAITDTSDISIETYPSRGYYDILLPSDVSYTVGQIQDRRFIDNESRIYGLG